MYTFFWNLAKYKIKYETGIWSQLSLESAAKSIRLEAETLNPIWQKFCQTLACRDDIIGHVLANELQVLLDHCPLHSHNYTVKVLETEMPNQQFSTTFTDEYIIGSGTIAQVYRAYNTTSSKWVAVKVKHPDIHQHIEESLRQYTQLSSSLWFPANLKACGDEFFRGLYKQADFTNEFNSGRMMKSILESTYNNSLPASPVLLIPEMIMHSSSVIIMNYEPGEYNFISIQDPEIKQLVGSIIIHLQVVGMYYGLLHSDLHWGNFSIRLTPLQVQDPTVSDPHRNQTFQVILYDFGWVVDISSIPSLIRKEWAKAFFNRDVSKIFALMLADMDIPDHIKATHVTNIKNIICKMSDTKLFSDKFKRILLYYHMNGLTYNDNLVAILYACIHSEQIEKMLPDLPSSEKTITYLPYPEFSCLKEL